MGRDIGGIGEPIKKTSETNYFVTSEDEQHINNIFSFSIADVPDDVPTFDVADVKI
jgi:hypothetical protein